MCGASSGLKICGIERNRFPRLGYPADSFQKSLVCLGAKEMDSKLN
jgi:hypothetical protein